MAAMEPRRLRRTVPPPPPSIKPPRKERQARCTLRTVPPRMARRASMATAPQSVRPQTATSMRPRTATPTRTPGAVGPVIRTILRNLPPVSQARTFRRVIPAAGEDRKKVVDHRPLVAAVVEGGDPGRGGRVVRQVLGGVGGG